MWIEMWILWKREGERAQHRSFYFFFQLGRGSLMKVERKEVGTCGGGI